ncbi:MAG: hypothetical protein SPI71_07090 [Acidaminococcaceae bacterium]|nr:hypothetical protein [Acidaminococcaceae bacterium]
MFEKFFHEVTSPLLWALILLLALRAEYSCCQKRDFVHAAAFLPIVIGAAFMLANGLGMLPSCLAEIFQ